MARRGPLVVAVFGRFDPDPCGRGKREDFMSIGRTNTMPGLVGWFRNIFIAVSTVAKSLWVTLRYWMRTYDPQRRTYTEQYEYPELPVPIAPLPRLPSIRLDDMHRLRALRSRLPGRLHLHRQGAGGGTKGLSRHQLRNRLHKMHVLRNVYGELPRRLYLHGLDP